MSWNINEALDYYKNQGAPEDQSVLIRFLKEAQEENGGALDKYILTSACEYYKLKESFLLAVIKRIPSLKMENSHIVEVCCGPVCSKNKSIRSFIEKNYGENPEGFKLKYVNCMRMCGKGPNIKVDGKLYNKADEEMLKKLIEEFN